MPNHNLRQIEWRARNRALPATALAARGSAAGRLCNRLLQFDDETLADFRGVRAEDLILILGEEDKLPWVDRAVYLGRDAEAPAILLPTTYAPTISITLFERILMMNFKEHMPFAVLAAPNQIVELKKALPVERQVLQKWVDKVNFNNVNTPKLL